MIFIKLIFTGIIFLVIGLVIMIKFQEKFIFYPQPISERNQAAFADYLITIQNKDILLKGWLIKKSKVKEPTLVIFYGGNAEDISENLWTLDQLGNHNFLFMSYRGYGDSEGNPSEKTLLEDALYIFDIITKQENIAFNQVIVMGRSLGSGVATYVAKHRPVKKVVLLSPFDSLVEVAKHHYPYLPVQRFLKHRFISINLAPHIQAPVLCIIGTDDAIVPNSHSLKLMDKWKGPKHLVTLQGASHNTLSSMPNYWEEIRAFLD